MIVVVCILRPSVILLQHVDRDNILNVMLIEVYVICFHRCEEIVLFFYHMIEKYNLNIVD